MQSRPTDLKRIPRRRRGAMVVAMTLAVAIVILFIQIPPITLLGKADVVGYAICHRIPERSFTLGGRTLPLCARCTGTFLGAIVGLLAMLLRRRHRASRLPPASVLGMLLVFVGFWAFDGLNSYATLFPGAPHLYEPRNWLRLTTGMLNGLALITLVLPIFNFTIWREPTQERVIESIWELVAILPIIALLVFVIQAEIDILLYPLAILSSLGVVLLLVLIDSLIAAVVLGREGHASNWFQASPPIIVGTGLALLHIVAMDFLRAYLTSKLGLPF